MFKYMFKISHYVNSFCVLPRTGDMEAEVQRAEQPMQ